MPLIPRKTDIVFKCWSTTRILRVGPKTSIKEWNFVDGLPGTVQEGHHQHFDMSVNNRHNRSTMKSTFTVRKHGVCNTYHQHFIPRLKANLSNCGSSESVLLSLSSPKYWLYQYYRKDTSEDWIFQSEYSSKICTSWTTSLHLGFFVDHVKLT